MQLYWDILQDKLCENTCISKAYNVNVYWHVIYLVEIKLSKCVYTKPVRLSTAE